MNTNSSKASNVSAAMGIDTTDLNKIAQLAKDQAQRVIKKLPVLGPVAWLMMAGPTTRHTLISELEWRVMPPLALDQAKLYLQNETPVAFASWAKLSEVAAQRYRQAPHHLTPADWNSGSQIWLIDVFTPFGGAQELLKDLREVVFKGQTIHQLVPNSSGQAQVHTWPVA
jgi:cytolysin-activating lysine-acyltransferase